MIVVIGNSSHTDARVENYKADPGTDIQDPSW